MSWFRLLSSVALVTNPDLSAHPEVPGAAVRCLRVEDLTVHVYATAAQLAFAAAELARQHLEQTLARQGSAAVLLATGNSQLQFLDALAGCQGVDWSRVTLFHMDEYLGIDPTHPASFRRFLHERVEARVRPRCFHYLQGDALLPGKECERYAALLRQHPIDLCCLGIGENGHLAFNDPPVADFEAADAVRLVRLDEACRRQQVGEGHFPGLDAVPRYAFTLTIPALCSARRMLCIVPEARKAQAVARALRGPVDVSCPASILRRQPQCTLLLDPDSASLI